MVSICFSKLVASGMLVCPAVRLTSDSADGYDSDIEKRMQDLDMDIAEQIDNGALDNDDNSTVQHVYFGEEFNTNARSDVLTMNIPDGVSEETAAAPVCKPLLEKEDDEKTEQHVYFLEQIPTNASNESSTVDVPDDVSDTTTTTPVCKALPSGHIMQVSKQTADDAESLFSRVSKYDKRDTKFDEAKTIQEDMSQLLTACRSGDAGVVKRLRENANAAITINKVSDYEDVSFRDARRNEDTMSKARFGVSIEGGFTPLILASAMGHVSVIRELLLFSGIEINKMNNKRSAALDLACTKGHPGVVSLLLLQQETKVNGVLGKSPLIDCFSAWPEVTQGNLDCLSLLLAHPKIDVNKKGDLGMTPLMCACERPGMELDMRKQVVRMFVDHPSTDVTIKEDWGGCTAESYLNQEGEDEIMFMMFIMKMKSKR
eukprot:gene891-280_t